MGATGSVTFLYDQIGGGAHIAVGKLPKRRVSSVVRDATDEELAAVESTCGVEKKARRSARKKA